MGASFSRPTPSGLSPKLPAEELALKPPPVVTFTFAPPTKLALAPSPSRTSGVI